jgi:glutaminase
VITDPGSPIVAYLERLMRELGTEKAGKVADYIPELGRADPESFAISLATVDGTIYRVGDADAPFTIQ